MSNSDDKAKPKSGWDKVDIIYATPLSSAFTKPIASEVLGGLFPEKNIELISDFAIERVDEEKQLLVIPGAGHNDIGWVGRELYFETLARFIGES